MEIYTKEDDNQAQENSSFDQPHDKPSHPVPRSFGQLFDGYFVDDRLGNHDSHDNDEKREGLYFRLRKSP